MIAVLTMERSIPIKSYGSTTFRREDKSAGTEPDECFYFGEINSVKYMKRFDPALHRAPDLWIEVDLLSPSVPREPICSRLGVPEVWRYENGGLAIRLLSEDGSYRNSAVSNCLVFVPISQFAEFVPRMIAEDESLVLREFAQWVRSLG